LPVSLQGYVQAGGVNIELDVDRPYLRNDDVVRRYGGHPHRRSQDGNDHGHGRGHHDH